MSSIRVSFDVPGTGRVFDRYWDNVADVPKDLSVPFRQMAEDFWANNRQTFASEGPGWRPLTESTLKDRARKGFGPGPILVRTGLLRESLSTEGAPGQILKIEPQELQIGTSVRYGIYHQTGSIKVKDHPPKRSPINMNMEIRKQWTNRITNYLRNEFDWAGER